MTVVALLNHSGNVGKEILSTLIKAHQSDQSGEHKIIVLHRASSDTSKIPQGIEKRVIDLNGGDETSISKAIEGIEVLISALPAKALDQESKLIGPLAKSSTLKLFIPSDFGNNWSPSEISSAETLAPLKAKSEIVDQLNKNNVPIALIKVGLFAEFAFGYQLLGTDVKGNKIQLYKDAKNLPLRISTLPYAAIATANLALTPHPSIHAGKIFNFIHYSPTGAELIQRLTKIHNGQPPQVIEYTEEQYQTDLKAGFETALAAAIRRKWGVDDWGLSENGHQLGPGVENIDDLDEVLKKYL